MTRIQLPRLFLLALLGAAALACGQTKGPAAEPVTTTPSVDASSPDSEPDAGPEPPPVPEPTTEAGVESQAPDGGSDAGTDDGAATDADQTTDGSTVTDDLCARFCGVLLTTACPPTPDGCQAGCTDDVTGPCAAEARADYSCEAQLTAADYTCDSHGYIRLNPGNCDDQETMFGDCLANATP
jgi:hypothetical protein